MRVLLASLVFVFSVLAQPVLGAEYYVRSDGGGIQATAEGIGCNDQPNAMDEQSFNSASFLPSDEVIFCNEGGAYTGVWPAAIILPSGGSDINNMITYRSETGEVAVIDGTGSPGWASGMDIPVSFVEVRGFEIYNSTGNGIQVMPNSANIEHVYLYDLYVHRVDGAFGIRVGTGIADRTFTIKDVYVYDSILEYNDGTGFAAAGYTEIDTVYVVNCTARWNNFDQVGWQQGFTSNSLQDDIRPGGSEWEQDSGTRYYHDQTDEPRRVFQKSGRSSRELTRDDESCPASVDVNGEWCWTGDRVYVDIGEDPDTSPYYNYIELMVGYTHNINFIGCISHDNYHDAGIYLDKGVEDSTIDRCISNNTRSVDGQGGFGVAIAGGINNTVKNTLIYGNAAAGIIIWQQSTGITLYGNTIAGNLDGIDFNEMNGGTIDVQNNIFSSNSGYGINDDLASYSVNENYNQFYSNAAGDLNNVNDNITGPNSQTGDPLFVDSGNGDYHLQSDSPCIDNGAGLGPDYNIDLDGVSRPQMLGWDIGAYELWPDCGDGTCDPSAGENCETCPVDCTWQPNEVCCSGIVYPGDCCSDDECILPEECIGHTCSEPLDICDGLVLLHHYDNNPAYGENDTHVLDFSGHGNSGGVSGAAWGSDVGRYSGAFVFDGLDDHMTVESDSSFNDMQEFTVSAWINTTEIKRQMVTDNSNKMKLLMLGNGMFRFRSVGTDIDADSDDPLSTGLWYHVVGTYDGGTARLFINGAEQQDTGEGIGSTGGADLALGSRFDGSIDFFNGTIDEVAVWNRTLSLQEIQDLFSSGSPIPCGIIHRADTREPFGSIDMEELFAFIDSWKYDSTEYPMWEMMEAVVMYYSP